MVMRLDFHPDDPGSIPWRNSFLTSFTFFFNWRYTVKTLLIQRKNARLQGVVSGMHHSTQVTFGTRLPYLQWLFLLCLRITTCPPEFQTFWRHYSSILARCFCRESVTKLPLEAVQNQKFGGKNVFHTVCRYMEILKVELNPLSDRKQGELKTNWVKRGQIKSKVA